MSNQPAGLATDPLFMALTRPVLVVGVTYLWLLVEGFFASIYFVQTSNFLHTGIGIVITHGAGAYFTAKEARFMDIAMTWSRTNTKCRNRAFHGYTVSYDLF